MSEIIASTNIVTMQDLQGQALNTGPLVEELHPALSFRPR